MYYLAPWTGQNKVCIDVLFAKLFSHVNTNGAITIVDITLDGVTKDTISMIYFLKLHPNQQQFTN